MTGEPPPIAPAFDTELRAPPSAPPRRTLRAILLIAAIGCVCGILTVVFLVPIALRWWNAEEAITPPPAVVATLPAIDPKVPITLDGLAAREAALDAQLDSLAQRVAATDFVARNAAGYAARAERLLIVTAARRELNRGLPLGYLEAQLHGQFDALDANAVATIVGAARAPTTLEDLRQALDNLAPTLVSGTLNDGVWPAIRRELSTLVVLRRETSPSPRPADRLERTRRMLDAGNVEGAMAEVARMPGAAEATIWIAAARRYVEARQALARLEMRAIRTPVPPAAPAAPAATTVPPPGA